MKNFDKNVQRNDDRIKETGEVFTPTSLVNEILAKIPSENFSTPGKTFLDPTCGNGQFLVEVKRILLENGFDEKTILEDQIFGVDLMLDNVKLCIYRLCVEAYATTIPGYENDFSKAPMNVINPNGYKMNICCADGLKYDYSFTRFNSKKHHKTSKSECKQFYLEYNEQKGQVVESNLFEW